MKKKSFPGLCCKVGWPSTFTEVPYYYLVCMLQVLGCMAESVAYCSTGPELAELHLGYLVHQWLRESYDIKEFPFSLLDCASYKVFLRWIFLFIQVWLSLTVAYAFQQVPWAMPLINTVYVVIFTEVLFSWISRVRPCENSHCNICLFIVMKTSENREIKHWARKFPQLVQNRGIICTWKLWHTVAGSWATPAVSHTIA